ncbi:hypothetical protein L1987_43805 [Smallanthus sonchifolius]|uniref:Uncharacterized protein n=1 Tax=Smallanthus sonchifolius TaxID=185202 RepID=A0ACB9GMQ0_9ASTR|nr:hypothetical protein L1987_43805 [Smallanthus sonchifolius]
MQIGKLQQHEVAWPAYQLVKVEFLLQQPQSYSSAPAAPPPLTVHQDSISKVKPRGRSQNFSSSGTSLPANW